MMFMGVQHEDTSVTRCINQCVCVAVFAPVLQLECTQAREGAAALQADYDLLRKQRFAEQVRVSPAQTLAQTMTKNAHMRLSAASRAATSSMQEH